MSNAEMYAANVQDGFVRDVIVVPSNITTDGDLTTYCNSIGLAGEWISTSDSTRGKRADVGDVYDAQADVFRAASESDFPSV